MRLLFRLNTAQHINILTPAALPSLVAASAQACPNCILQHQTQLKLSEQQQRNLTSDSLRLEAIKYKILFKLGLKGKPNVTHAVPRKVAEGLVEEMLGTPKEREASSTTRRAYQHHQDHEHGQEEAYGRASEIIAFAEPGEFLPLPPTTLEKLRRNITP